MRGNKMRFDYTKGEEPLYMVSVYRWNINDQLIYHTYKDAKRHYDNLKNKGFEEGTSISLYNLKKDKRMHFMSFQY